MKFRKYSNCDISYEHLYIELSIILYMVHVDSSHTMLKFYSQSFAVEASVIATINLTWKIGFTSGSGLKKIVIKNKYF